MRRFPPAVEVQAVARTFTAPDVPVRIFRSSAVIDGTALEVRMADEATAVKGRVRAVFESAQSGAGR